MKFEGMGVDGGGARTNARTHVRRVQQPKLRGARFGAIHHQEVWEVNPGHKPRDPIVTWGTIRV